MESKTEEKAMFVRVEEVAELLDISESHAYKIMRELNTELRRKGKINKRRPSFTPVPGRAALLLTGGQAMRQFKKTTTLLLTTALLLAGRAILDTTQREVKITVNSTQIERVQVIRTKNQNRP